MNIGFELDNLLSFVNGLDATFGLQIAEILGSLAGSSGVA